MTGGRNPDQTDDLRIALVAGEQSGDHLGASLMGALKNDSSQSFSFTGVGGAEMTDEGLNSIFPLEDVAVMGPLAIAGRLPKIVRRVYQTVDHVLRSDPDVLVIIDSPEFTHPIAKRVRKRARHIPIVNYVSPSVWAWRSGRAKKMKAYIDHVLGLLPFEPKAHKDLGGPPCSYVGHPLTEKIDWMQSLPTKSLEAQLHLRQGKPVLVVLPGSRVSEVKRLMPVFAETLNRLHASGEDFETIIPALPHVRDLIDTALRNAHARAFVVTGTDDKFKAFRMATCALAASGTVTLELALTGTPMVVGYKVDPLATGVRYLIKAHSVVLPNLILGDNSIPEFMQEDCTPDTLAATLLPLIRREEPYAIQTQALQRVEARIRLPHGQQPSDAAATIVHRYAQEGAQRRRQKNTPS